MAKPLKILLAVFGFLLLLLVAAVVALPFLFDPNDYRDRIAAQVKEQTGREFSVGEIRLAVFPWVRVELRDLSLGNAEGFGRTPMLTVKRAEVGARLLPLLREQRLVASTATLEGAALQLVVDASGRNNWQELLPKPAAEAPADEPTLEQQMQALDIEGLNLSEVSIDYDDQKAGKRYQLRELALTTGRLHGSEPFEVSGRFKATSSAPAAAAAVEFESVVALDAKTGDVALTKPSFKLDASQSGSSAMAGLLALDADALAYANAARTLTSSGPLRVTVERFRVGSEAAPALTASGTLQTPIASDLGKRLHTFDALAADLQLAGAALPSGKPQPLKLSAAVAVDLAAGQARISKLQLATLGLQLSAQRWLIRDLQGETPQVGGDIAVARFDPRALLSALGIDAPRTADPKVLQSASLAAQLQANAKSATLSQLVLKLDDSTARGELAVQSFATQAIRFALQVDQLDADRYLPPAAKPAVGADATPAAKVDMNATELPVAALDKLNAQGTLEVASMKLKNLKLAKVRLRLDGTPGSSHRQQLTASLYGGTADLDLRVAPGAQHAVKLALAGISAGPLLKDFIDSDKLSGRGSMTLDVTSNGRTIGAVRRALDGKLAFNLVDGAVKGFNLGQILRDGQALLARQAPAAGSQQSTDFAELRGAGVFTNGVLKSDQLTAKNPLLRLEGAGEINLVNETIDYLARPTIVNTASGQGGKERIDLTGLVVPIRLTGNLYKPKVSIDWQAALQQKAVDQVREKLGVSEETVREKREELRAKAKEEIGKGLLKLFGGKPTPPPAEPAPEAPATPPAP